MMWRSMAGAAIFVAVMVGAVTLGGCTYNDDHRDRRRDDRLERDSDRPSRVEHNAGIPWDSWRVLQGQERNLWWRADARGTIYVYDANREYVAFSARVLRDDRIEVRPDDNRILINGRVVSTSDLGARHTYKFFFDPEGPSRWRP